MQRATTPPPRNVVATPDGDRLMFTRVLGLRFAGNSMSQFCGISWAEPRVAASIASAAQTRRGFIATGAASRLTSERRRRAVAQWKAERQQDRLKYSGRLR